MVVVVRFLVGFLRMRIGFALRIERSLYIRAIGECQSTCLRETERKYGRARGRSGIRSETVQVERMRVRSSITQRL